MYFYMIENFISDKSLPDDRINFFGPIEETDQFHVFDPTKESLTDIALIAGFFSTKTQARKNGWDGPIPEGFTIKKFGKFKKIWIWNPK